MTMSDQIAVMMNSEITQCAPPDITHEEPEDTRVAEFIGSPKINVLRLERAGASLQLFGRSLNWHLPEEGPGVMLLDRRPEARFLSNGAPFLTRRVEASNDCPGLGPDLRWRANSASLAGVRFFTGNRPGGL